MERMRWGILAAVLVSVFAVLLACEALVHIDDRILVKPKDASNDASSVCRHRQPPPRPTGTASTPTPGTEAGAPLDLVFAGKTIQTGIAPNDAGRPLYQDIGFDLDNTCTGKGEPPSCAKPPGATANLDGVDGIDNAWGQLFSPGGPDPVEAVPSLVATTPWGMLRVREYSGDAYDDHVIVSLYIGLGLAQRPDGGSGPVWDGNDTWAILPEMLSDAGPPDVDHPLYSDDTAYVSNGVLVARFTDALWPNGITLQPVHQLVLAGALKQEVDGQWELQDMVIGLRGRVSDALLAGASFPTQSGVLCGSKPTYDQAKQRTCAAADLASDPDASPSSPCDALSVGALVQAKQARLGAVAPPFRSPPPSCAPGVDLDAGC
jgi:hypothetical protein